MGGVKVVKLGHVWIIRLSRPRVKNAVNRATAEELESAFNDFDSDSEARVAVFAGGKDAFCAGADLKEISSGSRAKMNLVRPYGPGPMGPTRMNLSKPVIAAIEGWCVAGGLELAIWADMRVAGDGATFGVFCRRVGVPLIDGGTVRLPMLIGHGRAMDMILTGRPVDAAEALSFGLVNRVVPAGGAEAAALKLARDIAKHPNLCMRTDRASARASWWRTSEAEALRRETIDGLKVLESGESVQGARGFISRARL